MRVALDTNILAYAEGVNGPRMQEAALRTIERLPLGSTMLPVQTLGELFRLLVAKAGRTPQEARSAILHWRNAFPLIDTTDRVLVAAADLATNRISIWDAVIVCAAAEAGCSLLLSEDMQDGFVWGGVTIANPFAKTLQPILKSLLDS